MNPAHYPALPTKGSPRAMSRFSGSFKEVLLSDDAADNAEAKAHDLGLSPSIASLRVTGSGMNDTGASNASPKIAAGRAIKEVQEQSPAGDTTSKAAIDQGISKSVDYVAEEHERWEPVSPKRQISLRRRAADVEAERAAEEETPTVMKIPAHKNMFAPLVEDETESDDDLADPLPDKGGRGKGAGFRRRFARLFNKVVENPGRAAATVGMVAVGVLVFMRQRRC